MDQQRNLILAIVVSVAILLSWQLLVEGPKLERERAAREAATAQRQTPAEVAPAAPAPGARPPAGEGAPMAGAPAPAPDRNEAVRQTPRVVLKSKSLSGSIAVRGARIDDLTLNSYRETVEKNSDNITLLSPPGAPNPYFAQFGWISTTPGVEVPTSETAWQADRTELTPETPVTLTWDNGQGLTFRQVISVDQNYMFTVSQSVENRGTQPVTLAPYGLVSRTGTPDTLGFYILHEGLIGVIDGILKEIDYDDLQDEGRVALESQGGWIGITDKYWLTALVPDQGTQVDYRFTHTAAGETDKYQVDFLDKALTAQPGQSVESTNRLFAGAKVVQLLDAYEEKFGIPSFDKAVDFGWFYWLTKPIFYALDYFYGLVGNFGIAILLLTVCIKLLFFPLANKAYKSMSRMKILAPKMKEIQERFKDDRVRQQQAMMELYKKEGANPMAGCLPILIQIPVFFALYKVLFVTIEMRHAPFFGWIQDLSAPDPLGILFLFGLVHWDVPEILKFVNIGIWPIIMGLTMYLQQKLNPQPADPMQAKIFMMLPFVFTFLLGSFPAGLVIYWAWNNLLSIAQQWVIMRRMGVTASGQQVHPSGSKPAGGGTGGSGPKAEAQAGKRAKGNGAGRSEGERQRAESGNGARSAGAKGGKAKRKKSKTADQRAETR